MSTVLPPLPWVQLLNHAHPAVAAQILDVLRPAAAQEAGWLGLPAAHADGALGAGAAFTEPERREADDLADIAASRHVHLGAWLSPAQARCLGVADPRRLAGVLSLASDETPGRLCIALLVVAPWAQRQGLARALVQAALQRGRGQGFSVTAASANRAAMALYQGMGFVPGRRGLLGAARVPVVQLLRAAEPLVEPVACTLSATAAAPLVDAAAAALTQTPVGASADTAAGPPVPAPLGATDAQGPIHPPPAAPSAVA